MLYLREDQAKELLRACEVCQYRAKNEEERQLWVLKQKLAVRYMLFNGLSPMELASARIEDLDPVLCELFLRKRHWKKNCVTTIDPETVRLQILYSGGRKKGPLLRSYKTGGHFHHGSLWMLIRAIAMRTNIQNKEKISPLVLKRTFGRLWLKKGGTIGGLKEQFSHRHLWSTERYCRFDLRDAEEEHAVMMQQIEGAKVHPLDRLEEHISRFGEAYPSARLDRRNQFLRGKSREKRRHQVPPYIYDPLE